jgi:hypothetical protein
MLGFHSFRQNYLLGHLNANFNKESFEKTLKENGFEKAVIAWRDPGEVLSMRKIDKEIYQYHVRLFIDGEIRAHYEYSPESHPLDHIFEAFFNPETEYFKKLLGKYLIATKE